MVRDIGIVVILPSNIHVVRDVAITKRIEKRGHILLNHLYINAIRKAPIECLFSFVNANIVLIVVVAADDDGA